MISEAHKISFNFDNHIYVVHASDINTKDCSTNVSEHHHSHNGSQAGTQ